MALPCPLRELEIAGMVNPRVSVRKAFALRDLVTSSKTGVQIAKLHIVPRSAVMDNDVWFLFAVRRRSISIDPNLSKRFIGPPGIAKVGQLYARSLVFPHRDVEWLPRTRYNCYTKGRDARNSVERQP